MDNLRELMEGTAIAVRKSRSEAELSSGRREGWVMPRHAFGRMVSPPNALSRSDWRAEAHRGIGRNQPPRHENEAVTLWIAKTSSGVEFVDRSVSWAKLSA